MCFTNLFFQTVACALYALNSVFNSTKVFNFNKVQLIFSFTEHTFGIVSKNSLPNPRSHRFSAVWSLRIFIVLHFTLSSKIRFELMLVRILRTASVFVLLHRDVHCFIKIFSILKMSVWYFKKYFIVLEQFCIHNKIERKVHRFPIYPLPPHMRSFSHYQHPPPEGTFVIIDEPTIDTS